MRETAAAKFSLARFWISGEETVKQLPELGDTQLRMDMSSLPPEASQFVLTTAMAALLPPAFNSGGAIGKTSRAMCPAFSYSFMKENT
jgi:hypothetical protein